MEYSTSGFELKNEIIVDSTARLRGSSSRKRVGGGEPEGDDGGVEDNVDEIEDS